MQKQLKWTIGKDSGNGSLESPPFRAYFYWLRDGQIDDAQDFSRAELEQEIAKRVSKGEAVEEFQAALAKL